MDNKKELQVGDIIRFQFDELGGTQERIIGLASGKYFAFDVELMCACHVTDSLEDMLNKYKQFKNVNIIKKKRKGE